jgi:hypothetical protein
MDLIKDTLLLSGHSRSHLVAEEKDFISSPICAMTLAVLMSIATAILIYNGATTGKDVSIQTTDNIEAASDTPSLKEKHEREIIEHPNEIT